MDGYQRRDCGIEVNQTADITSSATSKESDLTSVSMSSSTRKNCCKTKYIHLVCVKNKGAVIVLLWSLLVSSVFQYMIRPAAPDGSPELFIRNSFVKITPTIPLLISTVFYPIAGWLADIHIGRYKTIRTSLWIMWIGIIMYVIGRIIAQLNVNTHEILDYCFVAIYLMLAFGICGFQANIIQFGVDQLSDASASDISAFMIWYAGTFFGGAVLVSIFDFIPSKYLILQPLLLAANLSLALCADFCSSKYLVKEPVTQNPFKLVRKVLAYAIKNKHPRMRSAFTYWEDKLPSRIDLAKVKYGGPFTTEQVEDVKTFFRMIVIFALGTTVMSSTVITNYTIAILSSQTSSYKILEFSQFSPIIAIMNYTSTHSATIWVLLYKLVIHPFFHKWIPKLGILKKIKIGMILVLMDTIASMILNQVGHHNSIANHSSSNISLGCLLIASDSFTLNISYYWFAIPEFFYGLALLMSIIGVLEFICAQSPYSMKGLLIGTIYGMIGVMTLIEVVIIIIPFELTANCWKGNPFNCSFWMLTVEALFVTVVILSFCYASKRYKLRQREDVLPSEQIFADQYYTHLLQDNH